MTVARVVSSVAASVAVAGCAVVAFGMARTDARPASAPAVVAAAATPSARPAVLPVSSPPPSSSPSSAPGSATPHRRSAAPARSAPSTTPPVVSTIVPATPVSRPPQPASPAAATAVPAPSTAAPATARLAPVKATPAASRGHALPLRPTTGNATRVLTVTARSHRSTTATLQAWTKAPGGGWLRHGSSVTAHLGADGVGRASESTSKTPAGSFTLTQAFGHDRDPGTALPYRHTNSSDWWISQPGRLYNTHQRCSSDCAFAQGDPNEHLYYETPYYDYAVVIDYNTRNAPGGVHQGKGSAFFLHVTDGAPTAGCVAIPMSRLVSIMRWLRPSAHPRILIGVG